MALASTTIEHYPFVPAFQLAFFMPVFSVDINESVRAKVGNQALTNDTALKALKQIKWQSTCLSLLTRAIVLIPFATAAVLASFLIPPVGYLFVVRVCCAAVSGGLLGYSIENSINGFLPKLSEAYKLQSEKAAEYIKQIEANPSAEIRLD